MENKFMNPNIFNPWLNAVVIRIDYKNKILLWLANTDITSTFYLKFQKILPGKIMSKVLINFNMMSDIHQNDFFFCNNKFKRNSIRDINGNRIQIFQPSF